MSKKRKIVNLKLQAALADAGMRKFVVKSEKLNTLLKEARVYVVAYLASEEKAQDLIERISREVE